MKNLCLVYVVFLHLVAASHRPVPMLILKDGHSGSSWFTALLNKRSGVYIAEELFDPISKIKKRVLISKDLFMPEYGEKKSINLTALLDGSTAYLAEALRHPMKKFPSGALEEAADDWVVVGATYSPPVAAYLNLSDLTMMVPDLRLVVYVRTNVVKHAISFLRAKLLTEKGCGMVITDTCRLSGKTTVNVETFDNVLVNQMAHDQFTLDKTWEIAASLERDFFRISYEQMIGDLSHIDRLLQWAGVDPENLSWMSRATTGKCKNNCTKNTSDDLLQVVENYQEVESWIRSNYPCLLGQFYETRPDVMQPDVHVLCNELFTSRIETQLAKRMKHFAGVF